MRRLLAAAAVTAAALALPAPAHAYACGGLVDVNCTGTWCRLDCFSGPCTLWLDPLRSPHSALCIGVANVE